MSLSTPVWTYPPMLLSHRNHVRCGYGEREWYLRESKEESFFVKYGRCERAPQSFREECLNAARLIRQSTSQDLYVFLSGGSDSEIVARSFLAAGIDFTALTIRFSGGENAHDNANAFRLVKELHLSHRVLDLDVQVFFKSEEYMKYAEAGRCNTPILLPVLWAIDQVEGYPILGYGDAHIEQENWYKKPKDAWMNWDEEVYFSFHRFFVERGREGCPAFFQYTPELMLSWLREEEIAQLVQFKHPNVKDSLKLKYRIYRRHFELSELPEPGWTGFEHGAFYIFLEYWSCLMHRFGDDEYAIDYHELCRQLSPLEGVDN